MKTKSIIVSTVLVLVGLQVHLFARLGETKDQIEKRYGKNVGPAKPVQLMSMGQFKAQTEPPKDPLDNENPFPAHPEVLIQHYLVNAIKITVIFVNGVSQFERYEKQGVEHFEDAEIQTLLAANSLGSVWNNDKQPGNRKRWVLESGAATAITADNKIVCMVKDFEEYIQKLAKEAEDDDAKEKSKEKVQQLQGF